jgi:hypothetical protein
MIECSDKIGNAGMNLSEHNPGGCRPVSVLETERTADRTAKVGIAEVWTDTSFHLVSF